MFTHEFDEFFDELMKFFEDKIPNEVERRRVIKALLRDATLQLRSFNSFDAVKKEINRFDQARPALGSKLIHPGFTFELWAMIQAHKILRLASAYNNESFENRVARQGVGIESLFVYDAKAYVMKNYKTDDVDGIARADMKNGGYEKKFDRVANIGKRAINYIIRTQNLDIPDSITNDPYYPLFDDVFRRFVEIYTDAIYASEGETALIFYDDDAIKTTFTQTKKWLMRENRQGYTDTHPSFLADMEFAEALLESKRRPTYLSCDDVAKLCELREMLYDYRAYGIEPDIEEFLELKKTTAKIKRRVRNNVKKFGFDDLFEYMDIK